MTVIVEPGNIPKTEAEVSRVTVEDAYSALNSGEAVILDVRSTDAFLAGHIAGALSILLNRIEDTPKSVTLDKDQWIITYCT
jgi:rhodanese-related sulfurtransferase